MSNSKSKSFSHRKRHSNKTQRLRKALTGGYYKVFPDDQTDLHELKELLGQPNRHLLALHSSKGCGHCTKFEPEWNNVLDRLTPHPNLTVAKLGQGATNYMNKHHYRHHNHAVNGVPIIVYYIVNNKPQEYDGERTADKIIDWLTKVMADNNLELTIKPKSQEPTHMDDISVPVDMDNVSTPTHMDDISVPVDMDNVSTPTHMDDISVPVDMDNVSTPTHVDDSVSTQSVSTQAQEPKQEPVDAFPQNPLPPASTLSKATETIKGAAATVDNKIEQGVSAVKDVFTKDLGSLFSSDAKPLIAPIPAVPSLIGGVRRKCTRRRRKQRNSKMARHTMSRKTSRRRSKARKTRARRGGQGLPKMSDTLWSHSH
jgi:hypothetical protein